MTDETVAVKKGTYQKLLVGLVVVLVALSFSAGFIMGGNGSTPTAQVVAPTVQQQQPAEQQAPADRVQVSLDDDPVKGSANAPVTIVEFSDFECPYCGRFYAETLPSIQKNYIDTGKVKIAFRDFPLPFHPQANPAALASECAKEQGKFWEYHDKLFENQDTLSDANYKAWAAGLGMNANQFNSCYDSKKYQSEVDNDEQQASAAGVGGTPTFYIGSPAKGYVQIVGAQPYAVFQQVIEQELAA